MEQQKRVIVVGGCGTFGEHVVRTFVKDGIFAEVVVGDINIEKARTLASELDSDKVRVTAKRVEIEDYSSLVRELSDAQLIVNQTGPYNKYGVTMVKAAIDAKINYVDMNDDELGIDEVLALDDAARKAGVTCLVGFALSPGLANLFAKDGINKLDKVDDIGVIIARTPLHGWGRAIIDHLIHDHSGEAPEYIDGKWRNVPVFSDQETIEIPSGICTVGAASHPEQITLPKFISGVRNVTFKSGYMPHWFQELWMNINEYGLAGTDPVRVGDVSVTPRDFIVSFLSSTMGMEILNRKVNEVPEKVRCFVLQVMVKGTKASRPKSYIYRLLEEKGFLHSIYLSTVATAEMLFAGEFKVGAGVFLPEQLDDPRPLLDRIAAKGIRWTEEEK